MSVRVKNVAIGLTCSVAVLALLWFASGREWLEWWVSKDLAKPWAVFAIPSDSLPIHAKVSQTPEGVRICNVGDSEWKHAIARATTRYDTEYEWLARIGDLPSGKCLSLGSSDFYSPDWKKIPAGPGQEIIRLEILADVSGRGYSRTDLEH